MRRHLAAQTAGTLRHVKFTLAAHLADWHPYERYQDFFMASAALGGGGRGMKVAKEQIVGMVAAIDWFTSQSDAEFEAEFARSVFTAGSNIDLELSLDGFCRTFACRVQWRKETLCGVSFVSHRDCGKRWTVQHRDRNDDQGRLASRNSSMDSDTSPNST